MERFLSVRQTLGLDSFNIWLGFFFRFEALFYGGACGMPVSTKMLLFIVCNIFVNGFTVCRVRSRDDRTQGARSFEHTCILHPKNERERASWVATSCVQMSERKNEHSIMCVGKIDFSTVHICSTESSLLLSISAASTRSIVIVFFSLSFSRPKRVLHYFRCIVVVAAWTFYFPAQRAHTHTARSTQQKCAAFGCSIGIFMSAYF